MSVIERIQQMLKKSESFQAQGDQEDQLQNQLNEHCNLLQYLAKIYQKLADQRTLVEQRNVKLICENQALFTRLEKNKHKYDELDKKYSKLTENFQIILKLQEQCNALSDMIKKKNEEFDKVEISCKNKETLQKLSEELIVAKSQEIDSLKKMCNLSEAYSQTDTIGDSILVFGNNDLDNTGKAIVMPKESDVILSREDFNQLEENILMLREVLEKREESWLKLTEKDHEHRAIVGKLKNELAHMRQAATFNREELEKKSLKYKDLFKENKTLQNQINRLKKDITHLKRPETIDNFKRNYVSPYGYGANNNNNNSLSRGHFYSGFSCTGRQIQLPPLNVNKRVKRRASTRRNYSSRLVSREKETIKKSKIKFENGPESIIEDEKGLLVSTQIQRHFADI